MEVPDAKNVRRFYRLYRPAHRPLGRRPFNAGAEKARLRCERHRGATDDYGHCSDLRPGRDAGENHRNRFRKHAGDVFGALQRKGCRGEFVVRVTDRLRRAGRGDHRAGHSDHYPGDEQRSHLNRNGPPAPAARFRSYTSAEAALTPPRRARPPCERSRARRATPCSPSGTTRSPARSRRGSPTLSSTSRTGCC
jgi:hypothetical protein